MSGLGKGRGLGIGSALAVACACCVWYERHSGYFFSTLLNNGILGNGDAQRWLERSAAGSLLDMPEADYLQLQTRSDIMENQTFLKIPEIPIGQCSPAMFKELSGGGTRPVIVRGAHKSSPILEWTAESLLELFGNESSLALEKRIDPTQPDVTFGDRVRKYMAGDIRQVNQVFFMKKHQQLRKRIFKELGADLVRNCAGHSDALLPPIAITLNLYRAYQAKSTGVAWHAHTIEAPTTLHVRGKKTWTLVAPEYTPLLRPETSLWGAVLFAQDNPYSYVDWDPIQHLQPMISKIPMYRVTADPGDVLFTPAGWWHNTENERSDIDVISVVFSLLSAGPTSWRMHPATAALGWYNLLVVAGIEVVEGMKVPLQWLTDAIS
eukprot:TRINITY_DN104622_c0_g1_i1.p1 TRINITY_DN104622_c0_g1~~TRINITY_DN104622_c0_g1_i1.p1  ORF type:complete len:379 (+),score=42.29 TRINITY_DN104622_c0_g1_i1:71-1207(+)